MIAERKPESVARAGAIVVSESLAALLGVAVLVLASMVIGVVVNDLSPHGIPLFPKTDQPSLPKGVAAISIEDAFAAFSDRSAVFVDARPMEEYAQGHIAAALSLPVGDFEGRYLELSGVIDAAPAIVSYCSGPECSDAAQLAERLGEAFRGRIYVLEAGWGAWQAAGYPTKQGSSP